MYMYVQSFNTIEAKLGGVRNTKLLVFCAQTNTRTNGLLSYPENILFAGVSKEEIKSVYSGKEM